MSMNNFEFCSPTDFVFGRGAESKVGEQVKKHGGHSVLLHYGGKSAESNGLLDIVRKDLVAEGLNVFELGGVEPNPRASLVYQGISLVREKKTDFIVAVGGGSVIDSAKAIGIGVNYDGDFWDFYSGKVMPDSMLPVGVVLTIPAAGSEGSTGSVISNLDLGAKSSCDAQCMRPTFSLMNPEWTYTLPPYQTACGAADIMAHVMERYFTQTEGVDFTDRLCEAVLSTIVNNTPIALAEPENYDARANIMWAGMVAHNDLVGVGRQSDWGSHGIEHALSAVYDVAHGAGLAVVFPAWLAYQMEIDISRFAQFAVRVFHCDMNFQHPERTALAGIVALKNFFKEIGLPTTLAELGIPSDAISHLAEKAEMNNGNSMGYFNPLSAEQIKEVLRLATE